jgi:hypothetical protein
MLMASVGIRALLPKVEIELLIKNEYTSGIYTAEPS